MGTWFPKALSFQHFKGKKTGNAELAPTRQEEEFDP
jgi:hypothetical protein